MSNGSTERRAILQVCWGPMAHRKAVIEPSQVLRVGRDKTMGLALPHDSLLERAHFELAWNGSECRLSDLGTPTGTLLDGQPIKEGAVPHGGWIRAGGTDFVVYVEQHTPPSFATAVEETPQSTESKHQALSVLSTQEGLYALLDEARSSRIRTILQESVEEHLSLYEGPRGAGLADVAPYLVRLPRGSTLLGTLIQEGWGKQWGIYLISDSSLGELRRHLRKFLMIGIENERGRFYFRFYDPRVIHSFLQTCSVEQRKDFFGPITRFLYESTEEPDLLMVPA